MLIIIIDTRPLSFSVVLCTKPMTPCMLDRHDTCSTTELHLHACTLTSPKPPYTKPSASSRGQQGKALTAYTNSQYRKHKRYSDQVSLLSLSVGDNHAKSWGPPHFPCVSNAQSISTLSAEDWDKNSTVSGLSLVTGPCFHKEVFK